jgi:hypothetical protein
MPYDVPAEQWREYFVTPRYLAGSDGTGHAGFAPVAHWPHHYLDHGPCQLLVTSPDNRVRIGWFGDDYELWKIAAADDAASPPRWRVTFNHVTPAEIVAGLTAALARDYAEADPALDTPRFLAVPSPYWRDAARPFLDAGWSFDGAAEPGIAQITAPDGQAGIVIDHRPGTRDDETVELWAGPPGWGTRALAVFTSGTPTHLIAATAAAMLDPAPVTRQRHMLHPRVGHLVTLTPVEPPEPPVPRAPTPLDVRRTAVAQALHRAARAPGSAVSLRVLAARTRTTHPTVPSGPVTPPASHSPTPQGPQPPQPGR